MNSLIPLPWERLLWTGRPLGPSRWLAGERYVLTDFRVVRAGRGRLDEMALDDVAEIVRVESRSDRLLGTSTVVVHSKRRDAPLVLAAVRRGAQLAAMLELLAADPGARVDPDAIRAALAWEPRAPAARREIAGAFAAVSIAVAAVVFGLRGKPAGVQYAPDDAIAPGGVKRDQSQIVRFMQTDVMPWARTTIGRIKGGAERVTCETCHGSHPEGRGWQMPAVAALPEPVVRELGFETYATNMDAQMRNAIYGYLAEPEKAAKAAYMREVVVPGMAALLRRPAYDFTQPYEYNRSRNAIGCYHCHRVR